MANFRFNAAKGREVEFYYRVKNNDPAGARFILIPLSVGDTEANLQDLDTVTAVLAATPNEQSSGNWSRKNLTSAELAAFPAPNDTNNRYDIAVPQVTWTPGPTVGNDTVALLIGFDYDEGSGTDADVIPVSYHDFAVTADGNDVVLNAGDFIRTS